VSQKKRNLISGLIRLVVTSHTLRVNAQGIVCELKTNELLNTGNNAIYLDETPESGTADASLSI